MTMKLNYTENPNLIIESTIDPSNFKLNTPRKSFTYKQPNWKGKRFIANRQCSQFYQITRPFKLLLKTHVDVSWLVIPRVGGIIGRPIISTKGRGWQILFSRICFVSLSCRCLYWYYWKRNLNCSRSRDCNGWYVFWFWFLGGLLFLLDTRQETSYYDLDYYKNRKEKHEWLMKLVENYKLKYTGVRDIPARGWRPPVDPPRCHQRPVHLGLIKKHSSHLICFLFHHSQTE